MQEQDNAHTQDIEAYRQAVLSYEAAHEQVNTLLRAYQGHTTRMTAEDLHRYRQLAQARDALYSEVRWWEQRLLDDDTDDAIQ